MKDPRPTATISTILGIMSLSRLLIGLVNCSVIYN